MSKEIRFLPDEYLETWLIKTANLNNITVTKLVERCVSYCTGIEEFSVLKRGDERRDPRLPVLAKEITAGARDANQEAYREGAAREALEQKLKNLAVYKRGPRKRNS